jgi:hypothetical protein
MPLLPQRLCFGSSKAFISARLLRFRILHSEHSVISLQMLQIPDNCDKVKVFFAWTKMKRGWLDQTLILLCRKLMSSKGKVADLVLKPKIL